MRDDFCHQLPQREILGLQSPVLLSSSKSDQGCKHWLEKNYLRKQQEVVNSAVPSIKLLPNQS